MAQVPQLERGDTESRRLRSGVRWSSRPMSGSRSPERGGLGPPGAFRSAGAEARSRLPPFYPHLGRPAEATGGRTEHHRAVSKGFVLHVMGNDMKLAFRVAVDAVVTGPVSSNRRR